jgi:ComF family protein
MLSQVKKAFQKALFPDKCQACGAFFHGFQGTRGQEAASNCFERQPVEDVFRKEMSPFFCPECVGSFSPVTPPYCTQCGRMFASPVSDNHQCGDCIQQKKPFRMARSAGLFTGALMEAIHKFKYQGKIQFAEPFGRLLFSVFIKNFSGVLIDLIIPIPLHASKLKQRGFNQTLIMLRKWPELISNAGLKDIRVDLTGSMLQRKRKTESQTGLGKEDRKANIRGAFNVDDPGKILKRRILLVDDVFTTGATAEECAKTLLSRGAGEIYVLTAARV